MNQVGIYQLDEIDRLNDLSDTIEAGIFPAGEPYVKFNPGPWFNYGARTFVTAGYLSHNTYQYVTRDTYGMAMKATWVQIDGVGQSIFKRPVTDDGGKFSATGLLAVIEDRDETTGYRLVQNANDEDLQNSVLKPVWTNGNFIREYSLREVRDRVGAGA